MNDRQIAALKPTEKRQEKSLGTPRGLCVVVQPLHSGAKSFVARHRIGGKIRRFPIGDYPAMSLREARAKAGKIRGEIESARLEGEAPAVVIPRPRSGKKGKLTFTQAWALYMQHEGDKRKAAGEWWRIFEKDLEPHFGPKALDEISRDDIEAVLLAKAKKAPVASNTIYERLSRFFNWSIREGHALTKLASSPMVNVAKVGHNGKRHTRHLAAHELAWFFQCVDEAGVFRNGFLAALYTGQRLNQIFGAKRSQLIGDILTVSLKDPKQDEEVTTTPIWLHPDVMALVAEKSDKTLPSDPLFAGRTDGTGKALQRVEAAMQERAAMEGKTVEHFVPKTLRKTMSNWMGDQIDEDDEPLISEFTIERCLSHIEKSIRAKHYSVNRYFKSKKRAWTLWGDYLSSLRN